MGVFFILTLLLTVSCGLNKRSKQSKSDLSEPLNKLERIKNTGVLKVDVDYNSTNYFVYRGKPMGFKYDMLRALAEDLDVELEISVTNSLFEKFEGLKNGRFDLIAQNLTVTKERLKQINFTIPIYQTKQVLVQQAKQNSTVDTVYIKTILDLAEKNIFVQKNSSHFSRLQNLSEEIGSNIEIIEDSILGVEQLIKQVANGEINYTICDENVAKLNKTYYPNLDVSLSISFEQNIAWAVRKGEDVWKSYLDNWIVSFKKTNKYSYLYHKYFKSPRIANRLESDFHSISGGRISEYDDVIKKLAAHHNWDWRLISSIIYNESRFDSDAGSWAGAYGLMQLMPSTAERLGVDAKNPSDNIKGGILLMSWLNNRFIESIPDSSQRIKFVLASYNIGLGHVMDAQRLAEKYEKDKYVWDDNVDFFLLNKSVEKYYKDPVSRYGYCRGEEAYNYVLRVIDNYEPYLNVIPQ